MRNPVTVRKLKFDGAMKVEWDGDLVEAIGDEWVVVFHDSQRHEIRDSLVRPSEPRFYFLHYFNLVLPIAVQFSFDERGEWNPEAKCDAALPAVLSGRTIEFVDLDLDLIVARDLTHRVRDEETFAKHTGSMGYPPEVIAAARDGIRIATQLVAERGVPFDGSADELFGRVLAAQGPL